MVDSGEGTLNQRVAAGVRAELARSGMSQAALARHLGVGRNSLSRRLADKVSFTVDEVDSICQLFEIGPNELIRESIMLDAVHISAQEVNVERA